MIDKDRDTVLKLIQDPDHFKDWMDGLTEYKILEKGENDIGTITELSFANKGRVSHMIERVESKDLPNEIVTSYEAGKVYNRCYNRFFEEDGQTRYEMETVFKFGFFTTLFIWMFKGMFSRQTESGMLSFKRFVEGYEEK
jgi:ribosome-associated toxin RatA of RatAB toxin-antitoxin module